MMNASLIYSMSYSDEAGISAGSQHHSEHTDESCMSSKYFKSFSDFLMMYIQMKAEYLPDHSIIANTQTSHLCQVSISSPSQTF